MGPTPGSLLVALLVLAAVFWPLERLGGGPRPPRGRRRGLGTDILYWFFTPLVTRAVSRLALLAAVVVLAVAAGCGSTPSTTCCRA